MSHIILQCIDVTSDFYINLIFYHLIPRSKAMKLFRPLSLPVLTAFLVVATIVTSCSKSEIADRRADLLAMTPDDAPVTVALSPAAILKSAGAEIKGDGVVLPAQLEKIISKNKDIKHVAEMLTSAKGVDYNTLVIAGGTESGCVLFSLSDEAKFEGWAADNGMEVSNVGAYSVCHTPDSMNPGIVIDSNGIAWFIGSCADPAKAVEIVEANKHRATDNRLAEWKIENNEKNDINILINLEKYSDMISGIIATTMPGFSIPSVYSETCKFSFSDIDFDGPSIRMAGEAFDNDGKQTTVYAEGSFEPIPSKALNLIKDSQIAFGFAIPQPPKEFYVSFFAQDMGQLGTEYQNTIKSTMNALKSVVFGVSLKEDASIAGFKPTDLSATAAVAYDKSIAESAAADWIALAENSDLKATLTNGWNAWKEDSTFVIAPQPAFPDFKLYITGRDDLAMISTVADIASSDLKDNSSFDKLVAYGSINLKKSHPVLALVNCPFGVEMRFTATDKKAEGYITLTDCDTPVLETLLNFISRF